MLNRPNRPPSIAAFSARFAGVNRDGKIVQSRTPDASQASMIASHRGRVISSGFSTTTCLPAFAAATAGSMWAPLGVQTQTTSTLGIGEHLVEVVVELAIGAGQLGDLLGAGGVTVEGRHHPRSRDLGDRPGVELGDHAAADDPETVFRHVRRSRGLTIESIG